MHGWSPSGACWFSWNTWIGTVLTYCTGIYYRSAWCLGVRSRATRCPFCGFTIPNVSYHPLFKQLVTSNCLSWVYKSLSSSTCLISRIRCLLLGIRSLAKSSICTESFISDCNSTLDRFYSPIARYRFSGSVCWILSNSTFRKISFERVYRLYWRGYRRPFSVTCVFLFAHLFRWLLLLPIHLFILFRIFSWIFRFRLTLIPEFPWIPRFIRRIGEMNHLNQKGSTRLLYLSYNIHSRRLMLTHHLVTSADVWL